MGSKGIVGIPLLKAGESVSKAYIAELDKAISSDGCTDVPDFYCHCCIIHDLGYRYEIDPWGQPVTKAEVDRSLRLCMQKSSPLGKFSPISWIYWLGVRLFGRKAWYKDYISHMN